MSIDLGKVRDFAIVAHKDTRYGDDPYEVHLDQVLAKTLEWYSGVHLDIIGAVALLHDVLEDTPVTAQEIIDFCGPAYGPRIAHLVDNLSDGPGANRAERKRQTWSKIRSHEGSIIVKMADRFCNTNGKLKQMYRKEFPVFEAALYNPGQFDAQWEELRALTMG